MTQAQEIKGANKWLNAAEAIRPDLLQILMAEDRVFGTEVRLMRLDAKRIIKGWVDNPEDDMYECVTFGGYVITMRPNDWSEARRIAESRGWGEVVDGIVCEFIDWYAPISTPIGPAQNN